MESQTHYIKADPGYSVVHLTLVPGGANAHASNSCHRLADRA